MAKKIKFKKYHKIIIMLRKVTFKISQIFKI